MPLMPVTDSEPDTRCACDFKDCRCDSDADLVTSRGVAVCGCCLVDCPEVHDQDLIVVARAVPWSGGWELHVDGVGVTQVVVLDDASEQVRSLLATVGRADSEDVRVLVLRASEDQDVRPRPPTDKGA